LKKAQLAVYNPEKGEKEGLVEQGRTGMTLGKKGGNGYLAGTTEKRGGPLPLGPGLGAVENDQRTTNGKKAVARVER